MPNQTLYCEVGGHEWTRPTNRGPKPTSCPEHRNVKPAPTESLDSQYAEIIKGGVFAVARFEDGRERAVYPEDANDQLNPGDVGMVEYDPAHGWTFVVFERATPEAEPPRDLTQVMSPEAEALHAALEAPTPTPDPDPPVPAHAPTKAQKAPAVVVTPFTAEEEEEMDRRMAGKPPAGEGESLPEADPGLVSLPELKITHQMTEEERRQLEYIEHELNKGTRDQGDIRMLQQRQRDIVRRLKQRVRV